MFDLCSVSLCRVLRLEAGFTLKAVFILKTCSVKKKKKKVASIGCFIDSCRKIVDFSESKCVEGSQGRLRGVIAGS